MGKASITINVGALWNGSTQLDKVSSDLKRMEKLVSQSSESTTQSLALSGQAWENYGSTVYGIGTKIADIGDSLTKNITQPMVTVGSYCVRQAESFDTALANLNKTANLTSDELQEFGDRALAASKTSPVTAEEILNAEALGAQLGISNENLEEFANTANGLDIATNMSMETAATELAQFANIVGMADDETSNYGSTIVDLGNHLATTESAISTMGLRLAGTSTAANLSSADILGLAGAMSSLGIKAEAGGSAMTTIISNISTAVAEGGDQVEEYARVCGVSADEFAEKWKSSPIEALEMMVEGAGKLVDSGENVNSILADLGVSGIRQTDVMRRLIGQSDTLRNAVDRANAAWEENTALATEVDKRNESLESRFQTLQNNVSAAATEVGTVFANALLDVADDLSPVIDAVGDAATAFGDLDPSVKGAITSMAGIAAAAGPVLSIGGRLVQGIGNVASKIGEVQSSAAVFGDALNTVDGSQMRVYASSKSMASVMGTAGNAAAKAAGGAENYVKAWEGMYDASRQVKSAQEQIIKLQGKLGDATEKQADAIHKQVSKLEEQRDAAKQSYSANAKLVSQWSGSTKEAEKYAEGCDELADSLTEVREDFKQTGSAVNDMGSYFGTAGKAVSGIGSTLLSTVGPMVAIAAATAAVSAAIGYLVEKTMEEQQHQELLANATQSAADIMAGSKAKVDTASGAYENLNLKVEDTLQKLADLNEECSEVTSEYEINAGKLDTYTATIEQLAGQSNLTAIEQYRLKEAVEGYNDVCGTSYEVTDAANGIIKDTQTDAQVSADQLRNLASAWKEKAQAEAYSSMATKYLEAEIEAEGKLKIAQEEQNALIKERDELYQKCQGDTNKLSSDEINRYAELAAKIKENEGNVNELQSAYDTAAESSQYFTNQAEIAMSGLSDSMKSALSSLPADMQTTGISVANSLAAGIQAGSVSTEAATQFIGDGIYSALGSMSGDMRTAGMEAASALAEGIANGTVSAEAATAALTAAASGDLESTKVAFANCGMECPQALADAMTANQGAVDAAASTTEQTAVNAVQPTTVEYSTEGSDAAIAYGQAIAGQAGAVQSASTTIASSAKSGASSWSAYSSGSHLGSQFASGIGSAWQSVKNFATSLVNAAKSVMGFSVPKEGPWSGSEKGGVTSGRHLAENWATGVRSGIPEVSSAMAALMDSTRMATVAASGASASLGGAYVPLATGGARGAGDTTTNINNRNTYTLNIDGTTMNGMSAHAQSLLAELFSEFNTTARMG